MLFKVAFKDRLANFGLFSMKVNIPLSLKEGRQKRAYCFRCRHTPVLKACLVYLECIELVFLSFKKSAYYFANWAFKYPIGSGALGHTLAILAFLGKSFHEMKFHFIASEFFCLYITNGALFMLATTEVALTFTKFLSCRKKFRCCAKLDSLYVTT